jgi:hypothetical protein
MPLPGSSSTPLRFDLYGAPIPPKLSFSLPTYLGPHHFSEGARRHEPARYTLDDDYSSLHVQPSLHNALVC